MTVGEALQSGLGTARRGVGAVARLGGRLLMLPVGGLRFLARQASGTRRNAGRAWDYLTFDNLLPPSIVDLGQWGIETLPKLLGIRDTSPWQQLGAAITVIGVAFLATVLSGGLLIGTVVVVAGFGLIGLARFIPVVNDGWNGWTEALPIKRDYDVPRWKRD